MVWEKGCRQGGSEGTVPNKLNAKGVRLSLLDLGKGCWVKFVGLRKRV